MRLVSAAVDLCAEQGYDATTVPQIAERAGLTRATFFRHFPDKREVLFAGQAQHAELLATGVGEAPGEASPLAAVACGLDRLAGSFRPEQHGFGLTLAAAVAASPELQERDAAKSAGLVAAVRDALGARGVADPVALVAAQLGVLAVKDGYAAWSRGDDDDPAALAAHMASALADLRAASRALG